MTAAERRVGQVEDASRHTSIAPSTTAADTDAAVGTGGVSSVLRRRWRARGPATVQEPMTCEAPAPARWTHGQVDARERREQLTPVGVGDGVPARGCGGGRLTTEALSGDGQLGVDVAGGPQAVVANAHEAGGDDVLHEAADELDRRHRRGVVVAGGNRDGVVGDTASRR